MTGAGAPGERPPRLLLLAPYCYPLINAEAIVNAKLVRALLGAGWEVEVLTEARETRRFYPGEDAGWESVRDVVTPVAAASRPRAALAFAGMTARLLPVMTSGLGWTAAVVDEAVARLRSRPYDAVISRAWPSYAHAAGLAVRARTGVPWIANWNDPLPMEKMPPPTGGGPGARWSAYQAWRYRAVARQADWHTFPCERLRDFVSLYLPEIAAKSSVVPHAAVTGWDAPPRPAGAPLTLCHAGDLTPPRDPAPLLEGIRRFLAAHPGCPLRLRFLMRNPERVREAVRLAGLEGVATVEDPQPYNRMPAALADADVLVIVETPLEEGIYFPSKLVDYAQTGRPILAVAPAVGTTRDLVERHGAGIAADVRSPEAVAAALTRLHDAWRAGTLQRDLGSARLREAHAPARIVEGVAEALRRAKARGGP